MTEHRVGIRLLAATVALAAVLAACSSAGTGSSMQPGAPVGATAAATSATGTGTTPPTDRRSSTRGVRVARPSVSAPITGGRQGQPFNAMPRTLAEEHGYLEEEYFISGEATAYATTGSPSADGVWSVRATTRAPYTTRLLVRRPADASRFDGTVLVEWLNVSSGQDSDVEFAQVHEELMAHGTVWVGVSAQSVGIVGGTSMAMPGLHPSPLQDWDPVRYAPLSHPGDDYSYDMFSQAAAALLDPHGADPLAPTPPRALIAAGESQSAARMVTYVDAVHPEADIYDGFLIHSRSDGGAALQTGTALPRPTRIRGDLRVPVFQFETETDLLGLPFIDARQPDTDQLRTWEVTGTSHLDRHLLDYLRDAADPDGRTGQPRSAPQTVADPITSECGPINDGPQAAVLSKAVSDLRAWVAGGARPSAGPAIAVSDGAIARDAHGIALGGIRTPPVDVPLAELRGDNSVAGTYVCSLFGSTKAFDGAALVRLYPDRSAYVEAVGRSARSAVDGGHLLEADADAFVDGARHEPRLP